MNLNYAEMEPSKSISEKCGGNVRWAENGKLQQLWIVTEYIGGSASEQRHEWRDVPTESAGYTQYTGFRP